MARASHIFGFLIFFNHTRFKHQKAALRFYSRSAFLPPRESSISELWSRGTSYEHAARPTSAPARSVARPTTARGKEEEEEEFFPNDVMCMGPERAWGE